MENNNMHYTYKAFKSTTDMTNAIDKVVITGLYKAFKSITRTELQIYKTTICITNIRHLRA